MKGLWPELYSTSWYVVWQLFLSKFKFLRELVGDSGSQRGDTEPSQPEIERISASHPRQRPKTPRQRTTLPLLPESPVSPYSSRAADIDVKGHHIKADIDVKGHHVTFLCPTPKWYLATPTCAAVFQDTPPFHHFHLKLKEGTERFAVSCERMAGTTIQKPYCDVHGFSP
ncbi:hypothetical protein JZ751_024036 [Albula glossodonta]|uniref:Uncharacterized protein n=1 Tax=Albula glossodonta TaxID=121402 RepID=A0A8T2NNQ1_9TELE|nr:hypothetical protein JZ751_024036 [Albula glossodonta]